MATATSSQRERIDHAVQFYETDAFLADAVSRFLAEGMRRGEPAIVIATQPHRDLFVAQLGALGIDAAAATRQGRLVLLDAEDTLRAVMVHGVPDADRFDRVVGAALRELTYATGASSVRAYGEMVDVLWRRGEQHAAIALEEMWNDLRACHQFSLLCAYVIDSFYKQNGLPEVCATHSHVMPPERGVFARGELPGLIAENINTLIAEIARRSELEASLRDSLRQLRDAEEEARASKADLEDFLDHAVIAIHRVDSQGIIRWANRAELDLLGYEVHEYVGRHISEFHADEPVICDILDRLGRGESLRDYQARIRAKDGTLRVVQISSNVRRNAAGEFMTTRCFSRDVTALKRAQADSEAVDRVAKLLTTELDFDKVVHQLTDEATKLCGAELGTFSYHPIGDGSPFPQDLEMRSYLAVPVVAASGEVLGGLFFAHSQPDKFTAREERLMNAVATQAASAVANARVYEAERRARTAAERAERRAAVLHRVASKLSTALSAEQAAQIVIAEACMLLGSPGGAVLLLDERGEQVARMISDDRNHAGLALEADVAICRAARVGKLVHGSDREAAVPISFEGRTLGALGFRCDRPLTSDDEAIMLAIARQCGQAIERARLHDATQTARAEAEQASRAKDEFLAMLGHELRNPLSPILTAVQLMRMRGEASSMREQNIIERQVNHLIHLVDDLLDVSRITRGKFEIEKRPHKLSSIVTKALEIAGPLCESRRHSVTVQLPTDDIWIEADETRMCQVLTNLLTNAAKYTQPDGKIQIRAEAIGEAVRIHVKDNGVGIAPDLLPRVFDLFVQGYRDSDRRQGGLGIGLALVRNLVVMHGGSVSANSDGPGRGSEFVVELPTIQLAKQKAHDGERAFRRVLQVSPRRILVVDDNEDAGGLLGEMLRAAGHDVVVAFDGPRALEAIKHFAPEVAILDIGLPVMDGYELATALRNLLGPELRLLALTGYGQEKDRQRAHQAGFEAHFAKPVGVGKVLAAIEIDRTAG